MRGDTSHLRSVGRMPANEEAEWRAAGWAIAHDLDPSTFEEYTNHRGRTYLRHEMSERFVVENANGVQRGNPGDYVIYDTEKGRWGIERAGDAAESGE